MCLHGWAQPYVVPGLGMRLLIGLVGSEEREREREREKDWVGKGPHTMNTQKPYAPLYK
jgi:hypothetical protein